MTFTNGVEWKQAFVNGVEVDEMYQNGILFYKKFNEPEYIQNGLHIHFDAINNTGNGHDDNTDTWVDLINGVQASLAATAWSDDCINTIGDISKIEYNPTTSGELLQCTIMVTHFTEKTGVHPRIFGEREFPTLYLNSNTGYSYYYYGQGKDSPFVPATQTKTAGRSHVALRVSQTQDANKAELFVDGVKAGEREINATPSAIWKSSQYIGNNPSGSRGATAQFCNFMVYDRLLTNEEIQHNYEIDRERFNII